jgi:ubiquinone/menaquinone biosynthesis C-methylase UbiE
MEAVIRKPYQGVFNIIRFNWHFYVLAAMSVFLILLVGNLMGTLIFWLCVVLATGILASTSVSLFVSYYVYDQSDLYGFTWLQQFNKLSTQNVANIHAGFDETSSTLKENFPDARLQVFDFYDASRHTEISIERARKAYPPYNGTVKIATSALPLADNSVDILFNIFALHEVRNRGERIDFLKEQVRALRQDGKVVVVEHLRDVPNFLAYNIGFFHFLSRREWNHNFQQAGLFIDNKFNITPFINVFILRKADGNTP